MRHTEPAEPPKPDASVIAAQNDTFRRFACLGVAPLRPIQGRLHVTRSLMEAGDGFMAEAVTATGNFDTFAPENVSPFVAWLASPAAQNVSGNVFIVWGKDITVMEPPKHGFSAHASDEDAGWTLEDVGAQMGKFFEGKEPGMANAVLDNLAHSLRPEEMEDKPPCPANSN